MSTSDNKEIIKMKTTVKLIAAAGIAGLSLSACGASHLSTVNSTSNSASAAPTTTVPANAPVGFNAAKTAFVLPYKLGLLPADELALAKSDAAYAAGLANLADWTQSSARIDSAGGNPQAPTTKSTPTWYYIGGSGSQFFNTITTKNTAMNWNNMVITIYSPNSIKVLRSTSVPIKAATLNVLITTTATFTKGHVPLGGYQLVGPSTLEIQAAPVGSLTIGSNVVPAICSPTPEAYLAGNKVVNASGMPVMTAGPSAVFAVPTGTPGGAPVSGVFLYDKGVTSCASFH